MLATSSTAYTGSRSLPRSTRERGCALSLSICSRTLPFPSGARVSMKTDPETASDALKRFVASAAAWCEYPASCAPPWEYAVAICPVMRRAVVSVALRAGGTVHRVRTMVVACKDIERRAFDDVMQGVARGVVVVGIPSPRLAALDRVLELLLTCGEVDDVHLGVRRRVGPRDVQQTRRRQLGVGELALDLHILLQ